MLHKAILMSAESFLNSGQIQTCVLGLSPGTIKASMSAFTLLKGAHNVINCRDSLKYPHPSNINIIHNVWQGESHTLRILRSCPPYFIFLALAMFLIDLFSKSSLTPPDFIDFPSSSVSITKNATQAHKLQTNMSMQVFKSKSVDCPT